MFRLDYTYFIQCSFKTAWIHIIWQQENETEENADTNQKAHVWQKNKKQGKKKGGNQKNKKTKQAYNWKAVAVKDAPAQEKKDASKTESDKQVNSLQFFLV